MNNSSLDSFSSNYEDDKTKILRLQKQLEVAERKIINAKHRSDAHEQFAREAHAREIEAKKIAVECKRELKLTVDRYQSLEIDFQKQDLQKSCCKNRDDILKTEKLIREICSDPDLNLPINNGKRLKFRKLKNKLGKLRTRQERQSKLLEHIESKDKFNDEMRSAAVNNDLAEVKRLISQGVSVNVPDKTGFTAFMYACGNGHTDIVAMMIDAADINGKDRRSLKPLILAAKSLQVKTIQLLLDHGANIEVEDDAGRTPLIIVCCAGDYDCASTMVNKGANVDAQDKGGNAPLHYCAMHDHRELAELLIDHGASTKRENSETLAPAAVAMLHRNNDFAEMIKQLAS